MLLDKAFAYIHLPGTPLYVGEMVLTVGGLGVLAATGYLRIPVRDEPILALLAAFFLWGFIRFLPGFHTYGIIAQCATSPCATTASSRSSPSRRWREPRTSSTAGSPSSPGSCRGCSSGSRSP